MRNLKPKHWYPSDLPQDGDIVHFADQAWGVVADLDSEVRRLHQEARRKNQFADVRDLYLPVRRFFGGFIEKLDQDFVEFASLYMRLSVRQKEQILLTMAMMPTEKNPVVREPEPDPRQVPRNNEPIGQAKPRWEREGKGKPGRS